MTQRTSIVVAVTLVVAALTTMAVLGSLTSGAPAPGSQATGAPAPGSQATGAPSTGAPSTGAPATGAPTPAEPAVLVGAGDIGVCSGSGDDSTARIVSRTPGTVFTAGDNVYPDGSLQGFVACYDDGWGAFKDRTRPALGNHDYDTRGAAGYFDYFGAAAGRRGDGWYAFSLGGWRIYVLNSNCDEVDCDPDSDQLSWLRDDLAANPGSCVGAIWHHPLYSSGKHGNNEEVEPFWEVLYAAGADWVINAHDHLYERFAPQNERAEPDPAGIREFVVGTGGKDSYRFRQPQPNSEVRQTDIFGVIELRLYPDRYEWQFLPAGSGTFEDSGGEACSRR